jgi:parallel beta-helix repeat protein
MKNILLAVLFWGGCSLSWSATYYVDFLNGVNSNNGLSTSSAWKNCPGDAAATGIPAGTQIKAGDGIQFKGGVLYKGEIRLKQSGAGASAQITYDGNSSGTWGTGKALIDGDNVRSYGFSWTAGPIAYITIKNFEIKNIKYTGIEWEGGAAIKIDDASYVTIADCYLHDVGYWKNDGSIVPAGSGVHMLRPKNCLITGNEITKTGLAGIEVDGSVNCTISHNNIHDYITWGIDIGGDFNLCTGNVICDNTIHDLFQYDAGYYGGAGDPPHTDYIFIRKGGETSRHPVNNIVERNLFYNNQVFDEFGGTAMLFLSYADSTIIRNNVFINPHGYYAARFSWTSSGNKFYNNTIYAPNKVTASGGVAGIFLESNGKTDIRNNIIATYQSSIAYTGVIDESGLISDYNLFYNVTSSQDFVRITPARYATFADWKTYGYDTHSIKAASVADIKFLNIAGYPTSCQTMDLRIAATSPAVNAGAALAGFANDLYSAVRPQGIAWDIGACEAGSSASPISPAITIQPINLTVTPGQAASFVIAASGTAPVGYQWQKSVDNGTTWNTMSGATSASFTIPSTALPDNGARFRCLVTNSAGNVTSNIAVLTVNTATAAPAITTQPVKQTVIAGQSATFGIAASGAAPLSFQWQRSNDNGTTWNTISGATSASFTTTATTVSDNGANFRCIATNSSGSVTSNSSTLTVTSISIAKLSGITFGTGPAWAPGFEYNKAFDNDSNTYFEHALNNGGCAGIDLGSGNVNKIVKIRFHAHPGFEFRLDGGVFQGSSTSSTSGYSNLYTIAGTPKAGWNEVQVSDQNSYRYLRFISAANTYCTIAEIEFYCDPLIIPSITTQPTNQTVDAGQTATFLIAATGSAPLSYQWQRSNDNGTTWNAISGAVSASYTTAATVTSDNGARFRCLTTNPVGTSTSNAGALTVNSPQISKLNGTAFGTSPAWGVGSEYNKALDNNTNTFFEYSLNNGGYAGIDLGSGKSGKIVKIRFYSRPGFEFRMNGGKFQGSNTSSNSGYTDLFTIAGNPAAGWNEIKITNQNSFRYLRFISAVNTYCTISEMEFYGNIANALPQMTALSKVSPLRAIPKDFSLTPVLSDKNSSVRLMFAAPVALSEVRFDLFNLQGKCIETVVRHGSLPGYSTIEFSNSGRMITAGYYLCRVHSQDFEKTVKLTVR